MTARDDSSAKPPLPIEKSARGTFKANGHAPWTCAATIEGGRKGESMREN